MFAVSAGMAMAYFMVLTIACYHVSAAKCLANKNRAHMFFGESPGCLLLIYPTEHAEKRYCRGEAEPLTLTSAGPRKANMGTLPRSMFPTSPELKDDEMKANKGQNKITSKKLWMMALNHFRGDLPVEGIERA